MDLISSFTTEVVNKALDGLAQRHIALSSNLANVDTPNYRRKDVTFEDSLSHAINNRSQQESLQASNGAAMSMKRTRMDHMANTLMFNSLEEIQPVTTEAENVEYRNDGNSVDVESEMAMLAKNTQRYVAMANVQGRMLRSLRSVITNGGA